MFKAQIVTDLNGKRTVLEFDDQKEYKDYLSNHPELNIQSNRDQQWPKWFSNQYLPNWDTRKEMEKIVDYSINRHLGHVQQDNLSPFALVKHDMRRMEEEERREKQELEKKEQQKKQQEQELKEAKALLSEYKSKKSHNAEYAEKLQTHIEKLEKDLK